MPVQQEEGDANSGRNSGIQWRYSIGFWPNLKANYGCYKIWDFSNVHKHQWLTITDIHTVYEYSEVYFQINVLA